MLVTWGRTLVCAETEESPVLLQKVWWIPEHTGAGLSHPGRPVPPLLDSTYSEADCESESLGACLHACPCLHAPTPHVLPSLAPTVTVESWLIMVIVKVIPAEGVPSHVSTQHCS